MVYKRLKLVKGLIDKVLKKPLRFAGSKGVKPMHLTILSFILGLTGLYFLFENDVLAGVFIISYIVFDVLDGTLARVTNTQSEFGGSVDFFFDRIIAGVFLVKYHVYTGNLVLPIVGIIAVIAVSFDEKDHVLIRRIIKKK